MINIEMKHYLVEYPKSVDLIKGSGGLRKLRWESNGRGKSGGIRNIYYCYESGNTIYMVYVFATKGNRTIFHQVKLLC